MKFNTLEEQRADSEARLIPPAIFEAFFKNELTDKQRVMMTGTFAEVMALANPSVDEWIHPTNCMVFLYCLNANPTEFTETEIAELYKKFKIDKETQLHVAITSGDLEATMSLLEVNGLNIDLEKPYLPKERGIIDTLYRITARCGQLDMLWRLMCTFPPKQIERDLFYERAILSALERKDSELDVLKETIRYIEVCSGKAISMDSRYLMYALCELKDNAGLRILNTEGLRLLFRHMDENAVKLRLKEDALSLLDAAIEHTDLFIDLFELMDLPLKSKFLKDYIIRHEYGIRETRNNYIDILKNVCEIGNTSLFSFLWNLSDDLFTSSGLDKTSVQQRALQDDDYKLFRLAAEAKNIDIMRTLLSSTTAPMAMLKSSRYRDDSFEAFAIAINEGDLNMLNLLLSYIPTAEKIAFLTDREFSVLSRAVQGGNLAVFNRIRSYMGEAPALPIAFSEIITQDNYLMFRNACSSGNLAVLEAIISETPLEHIIPMIRSNNYQALRFAVRDGHAGLVKRLIEIAPAEVLQAIDVDLLYRARVHPEIFNHLLSFPQVLAYTGQHQQEYGRLVISYINDKLSELRIKQDQFLQQHPHSTFNMPESQALNYFYMLRHLIRRNKPSENDKIRFLLAIPAVEALAHQRIFDGPSNELLRLALRENNRTATQILLAIPAVRTLAIAEHYYTGEHTEDLAALARDRESSLHGLTSGEKKRLDKVIKQYQPTVLAGREPLFDHFLETLKARFLANPAKIIRHDGSELVLPVDWESFNALDLTADEKTQALTAYYKHKDHTALRFLSHPNHWMHTQASYVYINEARTERWSTFEDYKDLILTLWLAVEDTTMPPIDGHTIETRRDHFIGELAYIGRAHNWDKTRIGASGRPEEYDDAEGDRPSCFSGMKRRLSLSVIGHPLFTAQSFLAEEIFEAELRDYIIKEFQAHITAENKASIRSAWAKLTAMDSLTAEEQALLASITLSTTAKTTFISEMSAKYGEQFDTEPKFIVRIKEVMTIPAGTMHIDACSPLVDLSLLVKESPSTDVRASAIVAERGFFAGAGAGAGARTTAYAGAGEVGSAGAGARTTTGTGEGGSASDPTSTAGGSAKRSG